MHTFCPYVEMCYMDNDRQLLKQTHTFESIKKNDINNRERN